MNMLVNFSVPYACFVCSQILTSSWYYEAACFVCSQILTSQCEMFCRLTMTKCIRVFLFKSFGLQLDHLTADFGACVDFYLYC